VNFRKKLNERNAKMRESLAVICQEGIKKIMKRFSPKRQKKATPKQASKKLQFFTGF
jgi:hypothetical protein